MADACDGYGEAYAGNGGAGGLWMCSRRWAPGVKWPRIEVRFHVVGALIGFKYTAAESKLESNWLLGL